MLYLPEFINRDFPLLAQIRKRTRAEMVLLANVGCLLHCPIRQYHINLVSHSGESLELGTYVDYPLMWCSGEKARDAGPDAEVSVDKTRGPRRVRRDRHQSIQIGGTRNGSPVGRAASRSAYAERRYEGDLNDLILGFDHLEPYGRLPVRIPNRALDGFVEFFHKKHDCRMGCRDCRYCDDLRASVSVVEDKGRDGFVRRVDRAIERFESGAFRTASGK